MAIRHPLTADGLAVLALTARSVSAGLMPGPEQDPLKPLTPTEWARLAADLAAAGASPSSLLGVDTVGLESLVGSTAISVELIGRLAGRATTFSMEVERLQGRGIWLMTLADVAYPKRLRTRLGDSAPPVLYGAGSVELVGAGGTAIVGARDADATAITFAAEAAAAVARSGQPVISGGAKGIDAAALNGAAEAGGAVVGVLADSLERRARSVALRSLVEDERVVLLSPYGSDVPFSVGAAMGRNRLIYCLADLALVVSASAGEGGTWAGATEALKARWVPIYARTGEGVPAGNAALVALGARPFDRDPTGVTGLLDEPGSYLMDTADSHVDRARVVEQQAFFDLAPIAEAPKAKKSASRKTKHAQANP